jgi:hypothetical protein
VWPPGDRKDPQGFLAGSSSGQDQTSTSGDTRTGEFGLVRTVRDPKPNNLPERTLGTLFKGRDAFLADLRERFKGPGNDARTIVASQAVHGLGGVGKTRAAVEYAWRFGDEYSALLFVRAPSASELRADLADLVGVLAIDTSKTAVEPRSSPGSMLIPAGF